MRFVNKTLALHEPLAPIDPEKNTVNERVEEVVAADFTSHRFVGKDEDTEPWFLALRMKA